MRVDTDKLWDGLAIAGELIGWWLLFPLAALLLWLVFHIAFGWL